MIDPNRPGDGLTDDDCTCMPTEHHDAGCPVGIARRRALHAFIDAGRRQPDEPAR